MTAAGGRLSDPVSDAEMQAAMTALRRALTADAGVTPAAEARAPRHVGTSPYADAVAALDDVAAKLRKPVCA